MLDKLTETVDFINKETNFFNPEIAIVLGSGLACFCDNLVGQTLKYSKIPNFSVTSTEGHKNEFLFTEIFNKKVIIAKGRFHYYEGYTMAESTFPVKVFKKLGVKYLISTNAAGSVRKDFKQGDIMVINDHINFMGDNPLIGKNDPSLGERFPDMSECYDKNLINLSKICAKEINLDLKEGVYLASSGPSYETPAEVRAYKILGADVVGMSTVPAVIVSNYLKMKTLAFSVITNYATGISKTKLSHKEVIETGKVASKKLSNLIKLVISRL